MQSNPFLRQIPSVDEVLRSPRLKGIIQTYSREFVTDVVREILDELRKEVKQKKFKIQNSKFKINVGNLVKQRIEQRLKPSLKRIINLSGTILHTNLGRAILCDEAVEAIKTAALNPVNLEFDIEKGARGDRDSHLEELVCYLTGAEAATFVNNNAAAVLLTLNTIAEARDVIISRGELVEIGGSFRIPDIIKKSGCILVEVGTTNRTHLKDYTNAIKENTALIFKAHTSNYRIVGFTKAVTLRELVEIGKRYGLPVVEDLGSGSIVDLSRFDLPKEPVVRESIAAGVDAVTFSGDKLLGGPQAGIIAGKRDLIKRIKDNPLKRALRLDKLTIAGLEATLKLYLNIDTLPEKLPTLKLLTRSVSKIEKTAKKAKIILEKKLGKGFNINIEDGFSQIGSGSLPEERIPTKLISITHKDLSSEKIAERFLKNNPPILGRVQKDKFLLDMRMIEDAVDISFRGELA